MHSNDRSAAAADDAAELSRYLERVERLVPALADSTDQIERERRIPAPVLTAMMDAGLYRMLLPRSAGGGEVHPLTYMHVVEAVGRIDASTAWNLAQNNVCATSAAYLSEDAARRIFGDPRSVLAWGPPNAQSKAVACDGGYRVTGTWSFASGGRHASWLGGPSAVVEEGGSPRLNPNGRPENRIMLFPATQAAWTDIWNVIGLRGTASDSFTVKDLFVPSDFSFIRDEPEGAREQGWLYRFTTKALYPSGFASIALGVSRSMLDAFVRLALEKTPRGMNSTLRENTATQQELAEAEAGWRSARSYLFRSMADICAEVRHTREVTLDQRMTIRLAATHAIHRARQAAAFAYEAAGATAIFNSNPFERRFRDVNTIAQQVQGRRAHYQTVGQYLLGLATDDTFV